MKKILALVLALAMILMVGAAFAGTITISPPEGVASDAVNTYKIYKVFDAVVGNGGISYKLVSGKTTAPAGFTVDSAGNVTYTGTATNGKLTDDDIAAIKAYITEADLVDTVTATGSADVTSDDIGTGYFFINTTTGTVVTVDSTNPDAEVDDKNTVPEVDKKITGATSYDDDGKKALAQVGTTVEYTAEITIGKGARDYVFHDTMEEGLTYNNDVAILPEDAVYSTTPTATGDTFTVTFDNEWIKDLAVGSKITVTYSAKVNDNAITTDPLNNTAYVSYGDKNGNNHTPNSEADVYEAKFTVTKKDGEGKALANAGFVISNGTGYYKLTPASGTEPIKVTWYILAEGETLEQAIADGKVTEYKSDATGAVPSFTGLANGSYTLIESTVPEGYNKAADKTFTIDEHDYSESNLEQEAEVVNKQGTELPHTGGIGTTIFYVLGGLLVIGAAIILVARRKAHD